MKYGLELLLLCVFLGVIGCQPNESHLVFEVEETQRSASASPVLEVSQTEVDASCGQCQLGMPGNGGDLAIRLKGKVYYVDGSSIDDHGDAHADAGRRRYGLHGRSSLESCTVQ